MTIQATIAALKTRLALVDPANVDPATTQTKLARIYTNPKEAVSLGDFPLAIMYPAPQVQNSFKELALNNAQHNYTVRMLLLLGTLNTGLEELTARVWPWPQAVAIALFGDLTLSGAVQYIGTGEEENPALFTWNYGPKQWGEGSYFGITIDLPVTEEFIIPMA